MNNNNKKRFTLEPIIKKRLQQIYEINKYPSRKQLDEYAIEFNIDVKKLRRWFQNKRAFDKKNEEEGESVMSVITDDESLTPRASFESSSGTAHIKASPKEERHNEIIAPSQEKLGEISHESVSAVNDDHTNQVVMGEDMKRKNVEIIQELDAIIQYSKQMHSSDNKRE